METTSGKETIIVLRRLIAYSEKIFQHSKDIVTLVSDRREKPRISTAAVVKSSLVLFWARMGSINAWEQVGRPRFSSANTGCGIVDFRYNNLTSYKLPRIVALGNWQSD